MFGSHGSLRASPIFITIGRPKVLRRFVVINFPWATITYSPFGTGILPHVMLLSEIQCLKASFMQQTNVVVEGISTKLNRRNVGGDAYRAECVLDDIKNNDTFLSTLGGMSSVCNIREREQVAEFTEEYFVVNPTQPFEDDCVNGFRDGSRVASDSTGGEGGVDGNNDCADGNIRGDGATVDYITDFMIFLGKLL